MRTVVATAIVSGRRVLVAQRSYPAEHAGRWEFPGGAVEVGEEERDAVRRECREELGTQVIVDEPIGPTAPIGADRELRLWLARLAPDAPQPQAVEHLAVKWVDAVELAGLDLLEADLAFLPAVNEVLNP